MLENKILQYSIDEFDNIVNSEKEESTQDFSSEFPSETTFAFVNAHSAIHLVNETVEQFYPKTEFLTRPSFIGYEYTQIGDFDLSLNDCIEIGYSVFLESGSSFVGLIVVDKERNKFNLLHPYIAKRLVVNGEPLDTRKYSCLIVTDSTYVDKDLSNYIDYKSAIYKYIAIDDRVATEHRLYTKVHFAEKVHHSRVKVDYASIFTDTEGNLASPDNAFMFSPAHLGSYKGLVFPFYGYALGYDGNSWSLGPLLHANMSFSVVHHNKYSIDIDENNKLSFDDGARYGICTHSGAAYSIHGFAALNYCNFDSPLNTAVCAPDHALWNALNIAVSFEIFNRSSVDRTMERIGMKPEVLKVGSIQDVITSLGLEDIPDEKMADFKMLFASAVMSSSFADEIILSEFPALQKAINQLRNIKEENAVQQEDDSDEVSADE